MTKLHEVLAVVQSLRSQATACLTDLKGTFEKKRDHFREQIVTFKSSKEGLQDSEESRLALQTTVAKEIEWISEKIAKSVDACHTVDVANLSAKADVVLEDGTILLKSLPATSLLQLETRLDEIRSFVQAIPTLDPTRGFVPDPERGEGIYKARDIVKPRTEKQFSFTVMVPPTDKHPAQVKEHMNDIKIGEVVGQEWCSFITVAQKGDMLDRLEDLTRAVKKARSEANSVEIDPRANKIGQTLLDYVFSAKA